MDITVQKAIRSVLPSSVCGLDPDRPRSAARNYEKQLTTQLSASNVSYGQLEETLKEYACYATNANAVMLRYKQDLPSVQYRATPRFRVSHSATCREPSVGQSPEGE